jgi:TatD DNase family protein
LEQKDFDCDRDQVIEKCKKVGLKALITCCAHPRDFDLTMAIVKKWHGFVFATAAIHPEYIKEIKDIGFFEILKKNKNNIVAIGETGLDFYWIKEVGWREKQKELFAKHIELAKELKKPLVIHARDAFEQAIEILTDFDAKDVCMHMFGAHHLLKDVIGNGWYVSLNTILERSKKHKKIARDVPIENLLLETDSPWLGPGGKRNDPTSIKQVAKKIAEIKKMDFESVWKTCGQNAARFFKL